jgi:hypothetical protein
MSACLYTNSVPCQLSILSLVFILKMLVCVCVCVCVKFRSYSKVILLLLRRISEANKS